MVKARDLQLSRVVDEVLHYLWDPIGVVGAPEARNEYHGYVGPVLAMLQSGASQLELSAYLSRVAHEDMGLSCEPGREDEVASVLIRWQRYMQAAQSEPTGLADSVEQQKSPDA